MRLLWIATKPPVPPVDGGRLVALTTLQALAAEGVEITLVAPVPPGADRRRLEEELEGICRPVLVPATPRGRLTSALRSALGGPPWAIGRHTLPAVAREVERIVAAGGIDAVHAEQLQAFAQAEPALRAGVPVVLRAQNVESDLWRAAARIRDLLPPGAGPWLAREARRLARHEGEAVRRATVTVALTERDAERLRELAEAGEQAGGAPPGQDPADGKPRVVAVPPPFPAELPPGDEPLPGEPAVVLLGSGGWLPNRDGTRWFLEEVWPTVRQRLPGAVLHLFSAPGDLPRRLRRNLPDGVTPHPPPAESRQAFAPGSVLVVPLRFASGIRMKILEAWARGVPVVATPEAAAGLGVEKPGAEGGRGVVLARDRGGFAAALGRLGAVGEFREELIRAGRSSVEHECGSEKVAARLLRSYAALTRRPATPSPR
ncbi:MAG: glycosyltransferase family 4 protein [bacterium]